MSALQRRASSGEAHDDPREAAIREHLPLVRRLARRVARVIPAAPLDDLVGDGCIGLIRAVDTFDPKRGTTLETYARRLIAGAMLNGLRRLDPVSERVRRTLRRAEDARFALAQKRGVLPSLAEMERDDARLRRARAIAHQSALVSIDASPSGDALLGTGDGDDPLAWTVAADERRRVRSALAALPERQRRILALHYDDRLSLHAIGARMNVSPQRVSQLHLAALAKLRRSLPAP